MNTYSQVSTMQLHIGALQVPLVTYVEPRLRGTGLGERSDLRVGFKDGNPSIGGLRHC
jgi:hypothetical protein